MRTYGFGFVLATGLLVAGCIEGRVCTLKGQFSFSVTTCSSLSEDSSISGEGACADANIHCAITGQTPCTMWLVEATRAGLCVVRLRDGDAIYPMSIELTKIADECRTDYLPVSGPEEFELGPGCN